MSLVSAARARNAASNASRGTSGSSGQKSAIVSNASSKGLASGYALKSPGSGGSSTAVTTSSGVGGNSANAFANMTPTQMYANMTSSQQANFRKINPNVDVNNLGPALNFQNASGKYESVEGTGTFQKASQQEPVQQPPAEGVTGESPGPTGGDVADASGGQEAADEVMGQHQQQVGGMNAGVQAAGGSKQDVLNKAISSGQASVDGSGNVISSSGKNLGNISGMDMTQSAIGQTAPNANDIVKQNQDQLDATKQDQQNKVNAIKPDASLGLANSPDSPFWNAFGNSAIENENQLPGYMNERNKVIASSLMLNNSSMKFMSDAKRKELILNDIVDRQESGIDPEMEGWYKKTVDNINNLINREIPAMKSDDFFNMILKGEKIDYDAATGNPELKSARLRYNNLQKYSAMDVNGLTDAIEKGEVNKGGQLWNDLLNKGMGDMLNKAYGMYNAKSETKVSEYIANEISGFDTDKSLESQASSMLDFGTDLEGKISNKLLSLMIGDKLPTLASFLAADEEVQAAKKNSRATATEINDLADDIRNFADDIKTKVVERGGEATDDPFLNAYIQEKQKPFIRKLDVLNSKYRNEIALLDDLSENARTEFEVKEYNKNAEIAGYQFVLGRLDKQKAEQAQQQQQAQQQSNWERSFALQTQQANKPNMQVIGNRNGEPVYGYWDQTQNKFVESNANGGPGFSGTQTGANSRSSVNVGGTDYKVGSKAPGWLGTLGSGVITQIGGPSAISGLDIDGKVGDQITSPFDGTVSRVGTDKTGNNFIEIQDAQGNKMVFNHLQAAGTNMEGDLKPGAKITAGQNIGFMGNSGKVIPGKGGDGSHLDLVGYKKDGTRMTMPELMQYTTFGNFGNETTSSSNDMIQGIYNGSMSGTEIFNPKILKQYGLDGMSRPAATKAISEGVFDEYLGDLKGLPNEQVKQHLDQIEEVVSSVRTAFKDDPSWLDALKTSIGGNNTLYYLVNREFRGVEWDDGKKQNAGNMLSSFLSGYELSDSFRDELKKSLKTIGISRSDANDILDYAKL